MNKLWIFLIPTLLFGCNEREAVSPMVPEDVSVEADQGWRMHGNDWGELSQASPLALDSGQVYGYEIQAFVLQKEAFSRLLRQLSG